MKKPLFCALTVLLNFQLIAAEAPKTFKVGEFTFTRPADWQWVDVTSSMRKAQLKMLDPIIVDAAEAAAMIVKEGPAVAMQRFNRREPEESSG